MSTKPGAAILRPKKIGKVNPGLPSRSSSISEASDDSFEGLLSDSFADDLSVDSWGYDPPDLEEESDFWSSDPD